MTRLVHTDAAAYIRSMQTSRYQLFVFVEGGDVDPFFYDQVAAVATEGTKVNWQVRTAREFPRQIGGKPGLLNFFSDLETRGQLTDSFKGKKTCSVFFLDKDVDDLIGEQISSPFVIYGECYDVEGHAFLYGAIDKAAGAATFVDSQRLIEMFGDLETWPARAAASWKEWVKICLFSDKRQLRCAYCFGNKSQINDPLSGPVDEEKLEHCLSDLRITSGLSKSDFKNEFVGVEELVEGFYQRGGFIGYSRESGIPSSSKSSFGRKQVAVAAR
jgi:hypothetical protein